MGVEPIGLATVVIGLLCMLSGYRATVAWFVVLTLFGSAAAVFVGGNNIMPAHLFLAFAGLAALTRPRESAYALHALKPPEPGFWLLCMVLYGVASAFLLPRQFAGMTEIVPLGTSAYGNNTATVPLGPVSSNLTQSVYIIGDLVCFTLVVATGSTESGFKAVLAGLLGYAAGNVFFALLDLATYAAGAQHLLDFMRNARYTLHFNEEISGLKRIVGSFTEASAFARSTLGALAFTGTLWICGYRTALTGALALASLILVVLSTSSAGLAGVPIVLSIIYVTAVRRLLARGGLNSVVVVILGPALAGLAACAILLNPQASATIGDYVDTLILSKSSSDSGMQRSSWNAVGLQNFIDTWGLGVGLGTARTSSLLLALMSNLGVAGLLFYSLFVYFALLRLLPAARRDPHHVSTDVRLAASNACLGLIIGDLLVCPVVEQGLFFYALAGIAAARPQPDTAEERASLIGALEVQHEPSR
jgi:hypothetical protein